MASKGSVVYLGFLDEKVTSKNEHYLNFTVSKVGGTPDWNSKECKNPCCSVCKRKMLLALQIYAPLEHSNYHRTLYIFACITPLCWNRQHSWVCRRRQVLDSKQSNPTQIRGNTSGETWMEEEDWGSEDIDDGNGNICPSSKLMLEYMTLKAKTLVEETCIDDNLNQRMANSVTDVTHCLENQINLNEGDTNANESVCGAVAVQGGVGGLEASALLEGPEGDMIAVETPEKPVTDIPALFKEAAVIDMRSDVSFISYFVGTGIEPPEDTSLSDHERDLLLQYTHATGHELKDEECFAAPDSQGEDNVYEKMSAHHGDVLLHKFKKRILRSPQQILRYCREEGASPLWLRPPTPSLPKTCEACGGRLTFEAQITPQLVSYLRVKDVADPVIEFGSVVIYTCLSSCWSEGDFIRPEMCYVQGEDV